MAQIAAECLGVPLDKIDISLVDTHQTAEDLGAHASRQTFLGGNAVKQTAEIIRGELFSMASEMLEARAEDLISSEGRVYVKGSPSESLPIAEVVQAVYDQRGAPLEAESFFTDPASTGLDPKTGYGNPCPTYTFGVQAAKIRVDLDTGDLEVLKLIGAFDVGKAINPGSVLGQIEGGAIQQIEGGAIQGLGYALFEELQAPRGRVENANFRDYRIPTAPDVPEIQSIIVESRDPYGPFGAKGIGEPGLVAIAACIANALFDAAGIRIRSLPITREKILQALKNRG
jgi:xanthine dehydrogenase molybdenum-binding subunit